MKEVVLQFQRVDSTLVTDNTKFYLHDVLDHLALEMDVIQNLKDLSETLLELHLSFLSQRMNDVMRTLTIVATIFVPLTFITSLYGMNFKHMPELEWYWGYPFILTLILAVAGVMLTYFRKKGWV